MWKKLKTFFGELRGVLIVAPCVAGLLMTLRLSGLLQPWELGALDLFFRLRPAEPLDSRILIVGITESDIRRIERWPIPDEAIAQLLIKLKQHQPRAIGLDIYRDLPVQPGHQSLVKVFETTPNLIGIKEVSEEKWLSVNPPPVLSRLNQVGANNLILDPDGKVRRGLLFLEAQDRKVVSSLGLMLALIYLKSEGIVSQSSAVNPEYLQLNRAVFIRLRANDGGYVRTYDQGYQILMNPKNPRRSFQIVSMTDVLSNRIPADLVKDRIVLIGTTAPSLQDYHYTSYDSELIAAPKRTSGVEIHANLTSQIVSAALDGRPLIKVWPERWEWLWILVWSEIGAILTWQWRYVGGVNRLSFQLMLAAGTLLGGTSIAFWWGWWIPVVPALLALGGSAVAITAYFARNAAVIRQAFGRYLTDEIVANLLESKEGLKLGGEKREITLLTSDLRGFTAISEQLQPVEVIKVLNLYLGCMADVIVKYGGTIDEFMGDGILVLFGAPTSRKDDPVRAIGCAVDMQLAMTAVNEKMKSWGLPPLEMGIGINTGEVIVGNIGSEKRTKYGVVGDQVNLTYRIESCTIGGQILITESTLRKVDSLVKINSKKEVKFKGVKQAIAVYEVGGIGGKYNLFLPQQEEELWHLSEEIPLQYAVLDGKFVSDVVFLGNLVKISGKHALVRAENIADVPLALENIKLNLFNPINPESVSEDIYAKVLDQSAEQGSFYIYFTYQSPAAKARLDALYKSMLSKPETPSET